MKGMVIFPAAFLNIALEFTQRCVFDGGGGQGSPLHNLGYLSTIWRAY